MGDSDQYEDNVTERTRLMVDAEENDTMEVASHTSTRRPIQVEGSNNPSYGTSVNAEGHTTSAQRRVSLF